MSPLSERREIWISRKKAILKSHCIVVKDHMLLVRSVVRDFGPARPSFRLPQNYLTLCWRGARLQLQMKMASLTLVGTQGICCLLTDRMVPCPVLLLWPEGYNSTNPLPSGTTLKLNSCRTNDQNLLSYLIPLKLQS